MNWIREHKILATIVAVALALFVLIMVSYLRGGTFFPFSKEIQTGVAISSEPASGVGNGIKSSFRGIFRFNAVVKENEELKEQVSELERELVLLKLKKQELQELQELSNVLNYQTALTGQNIITGNVISMDGSNWFNIFTIDVGNENGVYKDAIVVNGEGLIGRVSDTGTGWAKVTSIIDESSKVSFEVFRDMTIMGILQGNADGRLSGFMFDGDAAVIEGDVLITSGIGIYPEGIEIGKVTSVVYNKDTQLKTIEIEPAVSFKGIKKVSVIL